MRLSQLVRLAPARAVPAALLLAAAARGAAAQTAAGASADARWHPWYGCWTPATDSASLIAASVAGRGPTTCVTPAGGSAVHVTTVAGGKVVSRERIEASGAEQQFTRDGCGGWEKATWSADGRRLYLRSELGCANNVRRTGDGVLAFARDGSWLDVRSATVGGYTGVRTVRYAPAPEPAGLPADVAAVLAGRGQGMAVETARAAAAAPATTADVIDVSRRAGAPVAAAWLAELRQRFAVDARQLAALADAGVSGQVTDVLVATAFPQRFALGPSGAEPALREPRATDDLGRGRPGPVAVLTSPLYGGWGWNGLGVGPFGYGAFGYNALGYGYGPRFFPGGNWGGGYWGTGPVVVVRPPSGGVGARAVPGRGYSQGDSPTTGSARSTESSPSVSRGWGDGGSSAGASAGSGGYSSGGSSAGSTSSGGGTRTAKPRP